MSTAQRSYLLVISMTAEVILDMLLFDMSVAQMDEKISPYGISDSHLLFEDYNCIKFFIDSPPNLRVHLISSDVHGSIQEFRHFDGYRWELMEVTA